MSIRRVLGALVALLAGLVLAAPAWADFDDGVAAIERGDYATALREFRPVANQGDARAQNNLGVMYDNGYGVPQDYAEAAATPRRSRCSSAPWRSPRRPLGQRMPMSPVKVVTLLASPVRSAFDVAGP